MTLKECYQILGLDQSASLPLLKRAYRQRAFALHPDLHPDLPDANHQFQKLNEAYVILTRVLTLREQQVQGKTRATEDSKQEAKQETASKHQEAQHTHTADKKQADSSTAQASSTQEQTQHDTKTHTESQQSQKASQSETQTNKTHEAEPKQPSRQEVLEDILNDSFARRVFEDIYSEVRKQNEPSQRTASASSVRPSSASPSPREKHVPEASAGTTPRFNWKDKIPFDFSKGVGGAIKDWLRSQIDEEQSFELPASRLVPGAKVRLQIRHGLSDDLTTLDVTLPPDFKPEKPIRLKGMGKKLGHWQGDLYLRFSLKA